MTTRQELIIGLGSSLIIFIVVLLVGLYVLSDPMLPAVASFSSAAVTIGMNYPIPYSDNNIFGYAEKALFNKLDPFSYRIDKREFGYLLEELSGSYGGIGVSVIPRDSVIMVVTVREGGPGYLAGLRGGDYIIRIAGKKVPTVDPESAISEIRGPSGSIVALTIYRPTLQDTMTVNVTRAPIHLDHLTYYGMTHNRAAYIRLADFEAGTTEDLKIALLDMEYRSPIGYIVDLRGNPGGYLDEGVDAADLFLNKGELIVGTDSRSRWDNREYRAKNMALTTRPVVMLTNRGTASAAEIFCGALRAANRGVVIGDTTFGKGLVQSVYSLFDGDAMRLTTARYYFADGRYLNPPDSALTFKGLAPDLCYEEGGEMAFKALILSTFIIYDFVESNWDYLSSLPDQETYPDTVIAMFIDFARENGIEYKSWSTAAIESALSGQVVGEGLARIVEKLDQLKSLSLVVDLQTYYRMGEFLKYQIRRLVVERKSGRAIAYRDVIVPTQAIIKRAAEILVDSTEYQNLLEGDISHRQPLATRK